MSDILRRDPRREWIARNRLHPEHETVTAAAQPERWVGPNGVVRRNPHAVGFVGPNGVRRIDRSGARFGAGEGVRRKSETVPARRRVVIDEPAFLVAVVPDLVGGRLSGHDRDLFGLARQLAGDRGAVLAVVLGAVRDADMGEAGADRLVRLDDDSLEGFAPESRVAALAVVERTHAPVHWLLPDSRTGGGDLGRRLAPRLGERPATGVWQVEGGHCRARGAAGTEDILRPLPKVVLALEECAEPVLDTTHEARVLESGGLTPSTLTRIADHGSVAVDPAAIPLAEAEFILSAGNGVRDWAAFHGAARELGATEGASRVAVDDGHMPRDRQVGASGTWVSARVYVAAGISGAIQHLQGIQSCERVVAINRDPGCDMVRRADLSVIGDAGAILEALVRRVNSAREEANSDAA